MAAHGGRQAAWVERVQHRAWSAGLRVSVTCAIPCSTRASEPCQDNNHNTHSLISLVQHPPPAASAACAPTASPPIQPPLPPPGAHPHSLFHEFECSIPHLQVVFFMLQLFSLPRSHLLLPLRRLRPRLALALVPRQLLLTLLSAGRQAKGEEATAAPLNHRIPTYNTHSKAHRDTEVHTGAHRQQQEQLGPTQEAPPGTPAPRPSAPLLGFLSGHPRPLPRRHLLGAVAALAVVKVAVPVLYKLCAHLQAGGQAGRQAARAGRQRQQRGGEGSKRTAGAGRQAATLPAACALLPQCGAMKRHAMPCHAMPCCALCQQCQRPCPSRSEYCCLCRTCNSTGRLPTGNLSVLPCMRSRPPPPPLCPLCPLLGDTEA